MYRRSAAEPGGGRRAHTGVCSKFAEIHGTASGFGPSYLMTDHRTVRRTAGAAHVETESFQSDRLRMKIFEKREPITIRMRPKQQAGNFSTEGGTVLNAHRRKYRATGT